MWLAADGYAVESETIAGAQNLVLQRQGFHIPEDGQFGLCPFFLLHLVVLLSASAVNRRPEAGYYELNPLDRSQRARFTAANICVDSPWDFT
jgi:hypothetical protein